MTDVSLTSNKSSNSTLSVPKLRDNGSNWSDYELRISKALGAKGVWRHVEGTAHSPKPYAVVSGVPVLADGKTAATENQIEARGDAKIEEYEKKQYLAQHVILSTTSIRLGAKIKNLKTAKEMWDTVKTDATTKSTLYLIDAEDQLASMRCHESSDPKTHLAELKAHFELMVQYCDNLTNMGSTFSNTHFRIIIMGSLPLSYRPSLQTITAASKADNTNLTPKELVAFFTASSN